MPKFSVFQIWPIGGGSFHKLANSSVWSVAQCSTGRLTTLPPACQSACVANNHFQTYTRAFILAIMHARVTVNLFTQCIARARPMCSQYARASSALDSQVKFTPHLQACEILRCAWPFRPSALCAPCSACWSSYQTRFTLVSLQACHASAPVCTPVRSFHCSYYHQSPFSTEFLLLQFQQVQHLNHIPTSMINLVFLLKSCTI